MVRIYNPCPYFKKQKLHQTMSFIHFGENDIGLLVVARIVHLRERACVGDAHFF